MDYLWLPLPSSLILRESDIAEESAPCQPPELQADLAVGLEMERGRGYLESALKNLQISNYRERFSVFCWPTTWRSRLTSANLSKLLCVFLWLLILKSIIYLFSNVVFPRDLIHVSILTADGIFLLRGQIPVCQRTSRINWKIQNYLIWLYIWVLNYKFL